MPALIRGKVIPRRTDCGRIISAERVHLKALTRAGFPNRGMRTA
jgi:hypothetical protein